MRIIIQKFGGTSVATAAQRSRAAERVIEAKKQGLSPVVVVSAMGRSGEPYATDTLIGLVREINPNVDMRDQDLLISCGEVISSVVMAETLEVMGHPAIALTGAQAGIVTDDNFGDTSIIEVRPDRVRSHLDEGKVVVVAGFQGVTRSGEITTLGRGGSDTTAAALGVALGAEMIEIYTDVDGVMTADPRVVPDARPLGMITYHEVCEMAHLGAKVIHPRAVEIAMQAGIPIKILSASSGAPGTIICEGKRMPVTRIHTDKVVTGVAHIAHLAQIKICCPADVNESGMARRVFRVLADAGVSVDLINMFPEMIAVTVREDVLDRALAAVGSLDMPSMNVTSMRDCAKVSVVGAGMRGVPGVMARVVEALNDRGIPILQTSDSHTSISCLVRQADMQEAMRSLHSKFGLGACQDA
ncbi:MAG TPA: aspartate kinase [Firmicutes bacterium]|nr:aspartate kinase [Bacillota bacterium]